MTRVKRAVNARKAKNKILKQAKGYRGSRSKSYRIAKDSVQKALLYAYRDRRNKKRQFRRLWIVRINAAARQNDISYSDFMFGLRKQNIEIDRKILANIAYNDHVVFSKLAEKAKSTFN